jgi:hypothetical protein
MPIEKSALTIFGTRLFGGWMIDPIIPDGDISPLGAPLPDMINYEILTLLGLAALPALGNFSGSVLPSTKQ